jgi:RhoGAP domain
MSYLSAIHSVIQIVFTYLLLRCLVVQGLFRVAASGTRVKKLKASFDANVVDIDEYKHDVHCIAGESPVHCDVIASQVVDVIVMTSF